MTCAHSQLLEDPNVLFGGYKNPHPLEPAIQIKVQTRPEGQNPVQARRSQPALLLRLGSPSRTAAAVCARRALIADAHLAARQAMHSALDSLHAELDTFEERFKVAILSHQEQTNHGAALMDET